MLGAVALQRCIVCFATFLEMNHRFPTTAITLHTQAGKLIQVKKAQRADVDGIKDSP